MHPRWGKVHVFYKPLTFHFFTKKTPPFSTFVREKHPSQFHFLPTGLRTQHDWGLGVPTTNVGLFHVQIQSQHKQMLLFAAINHLTFTGHKRLMQQTFRSPKQATSYSFKEITFYHWRKSCTNPTSTQTNVPICYYQSSDIHRTQTTHATDISITETGHVLHRAVD